MPRPRLDGLSGREEQILGLAADGLLDKQIATTLNVSENTLRTYWRRIRTKLGDVSRSALAAQYAKVLSEDPDEQGFWTFDFENSRVTFRGDREVLPQGDSTMSDAIEVFHPHDRKSLLSIMNGLIEHDSPPVTVAVRVLTTTGFEQVYMRLEPVLGMKGKIVHLAGRTYPVLDLTLDATKVAHFGHYRRDLDTGVVEVDEGLRAIFRIAPDETDLRAAVLRRYCPLSLEKMKNMVDGMVASGHKRRRWTSCLCFEDGEKVWVTSQSHLEEKNGRPVAFVATAIAFF